MNLQLMGKKALVTGSTAGIGYAIAEALAREGAAVVVNGRTEARVLNAISRLKQAAPQADVSGVAADLGTAEGVAKLTAVVLDMEILVNNLGIFDPKPFSEIGDDELMKTFEVNVLSGVRLSRAYLPGMRERNWGRIVFISSESAVNIPAEMIQYGGTKTAQVALARGLAETTVGTGITVNSVLPGPTRSEGVGTFVENLAKAQNIDPSEVEKQFFETMRPSSLLKRFAEPSEVAALVAYMCSPVAGATNGAALRVDGGVVRSIF